MKRAKLKCCHQSQSKLRLMQIPKLMELVKSLMAAQVQMAKALQKARVLLEHRSLPKPTELVETQR